MDENRKPNPPIDAEPDMPEDWDDQEGWNAYHAVMARRAAGRPVSRMDASSIRFFSFVSTLGERVWFPGCGLDVGPVLYSTLGMHVLATDLAASAVEYQRALAARPVEEILENGEAILEQCSAKPHAGSLEARVHDQRTPPGGGPFDAVINVRAFQGLSRDSMSRAAAVMFGALRPGGRAIFDTMNVQGARRTMLEASLATAGFYLPCQKTERWYRETLEATGIEYLMILGRPFVSGWTKYPRASDPSATKESDEQLLRSFEAEYHARLEAERPESEALQTDGRTIAAYVVYSTG